MSAYSPASLPSLEEVRAEKARRTASRSLLDLFPAQPGPQTEFIESQADITIYGGSAGGGKSWGLLIGPSDHLSNPRFGAVVFRRTMKQVKDEGGIWDQSAEIYPKIGAKANRSECYWTFPSGAVVQFAGLENETSKYDYQGAEICELDFDELTHFSEATFFYLLSRNRSTCGVRPRVRATVNPEPGWVKRLVAPWVDRKFPGDKAKSGEVRYFIRENNQIVWVPKPPERGQCKDGPEGERCLKDGCLKCFPPEKSITFIRASVFDNRKLLEVNPEYISNLRALHDIDRKRLLDGDWDARPAHRVVASFDESVHVASYREVPILWKRFVGSDFGKLNGAELALAEDPVTKKLIVIAEDWPGHERTYEEIGESILRLCGRTPDRGAGGNRTTEQGWRQAMRKEGIPMEEPNPKHADPGLQYQCVSDAFASGELEVMENCPKLIGMLNNLQHLLDDEGEPTDKFDDGKFHLCAALRYIITLLRPPKDNSAISVSPTTQQSPLPQPNSQLGASTTSVGGRLMIQEPVKKVRLW